MELASYALSLQYFQSEALRQSYNYRAVFVCFEHGRAMVACRSGRTLHGIVKQFYSSMVKVKPGAKVITIEPAQNASTIEWVVRLLSAAFGRVSAEW
jgi:hypothetical protein